MFSKRGEIALSLITVMEIILGLSIALLFFSAAYAIGDQERLEDFAMAKDIAILINSIEAVSHTVHYEYSENGFGTNVHIENLVVAVIPASSSIPKANFFSTSKYGFHPGPSSLEIIPAVVNGGFFSINKHDNVLFFSNQSTFTYEDSAVPKTPLEELSFLVENDYSENSQYRTKLASLQSALQGNLQNTFEISENPTHYIGLSVGEENIIYYSNSLEMRSLAQAIANTLQILEQQEFLLLQQEHFFSANKQYVELQLQTTFLEELEIGLFATGVKGSIDNFYEE